jgi:cytochrome c oxidase assembly factor CtaG
MSEDFERGISEKSDGVFDSAAAEHWFSQVVNFLRIAESVLMWRVRIHSAPFWQNLPEKLELGFIVVS